MEHVSRKSRFWFNTILLALCLLGLGFFSPELSEWIESSHAGSSPTIRARNSLSELERNGEEIVLAGKHKNRELQASMAGGLVIQGQDAACSRCHGTWFEGQVEGFNRAPGISHVQLAAGAKKAGKSIPEVLENALVRGVGIDGRVLSAYMPRFDVRSQELMALQAWFSVKDDLFDSGVTSSEILIGVIDGPHQQSPHLAGQLNELEKDYSVFGRKLRFETMSYRDVKANKGRFFAYLNPESWPIEEDDEPSLILSFERQEGVTGSVAHDRELFLLDSHQSWRELIFKYFPAVQDVTSREFLPTCKGQFLVGATFKSVITACQKKMRGHQADESEFYVRWIDPSAEDFGIADSAMTNPATRELLLRSSVLVAIMRKALEQTGDRPTRTALFKKLRSGHVLKVNGLNVSFGLANQAGLHGSFVFRWDPELEDYRIHWLSF